MSQLVMRESPDDHALGPKDAPIHLVEYGDYQCPFCGRAHREVKRLLRAMGDRVRFVFRNFPLTQIHPRALPAALAVEAAGAQGKFWQMHDLVYDNQHDLELPALMSYASTVGVDLNRFADDLMNERYREKIRRDFMSGVRSGVNGTPTFFINGRRHDGAFTADALMDAIQGPAAYGY